MTFTYFHINIELYKQHRTTFFLRILETLQISLKSPGLPLVSAPAVSYHPFFPPRCSMLGEPSQQFQSSLAPRWLWPWGGLQDIRVRKENGVGDSFLTLPLRGYVRLAAAVEGSAPHLSRNVA